MNGFALYEYTIDEGFDPIRYVGPDDPSTIDEEWVAVVAEDYGYDAPSDSKAQLVLSIMATHWPMLDEIMGLQPPVVCFGGNPEDFENDVARYVFESASSQRSPVIVVAPYLPKDQAEITILHEIAHAYLDSRGVPPEDHDEDLVESFGEMALRGSYEFAVEMLDGFAQGVDVSGSPIGREWQSQEGLKKVIGLLGEDRVVIETPSSRESGFGHHVLPLTELEDEIDLDERKAASAGRMAQRVATAEAKEEAALAEREDTEGFADQFSPLKRGRIIKTLNATMTLDRGPVKTRKQHVRDLVAKGFRPAVVPGVGEVLQGPDETYYRAKDLTKTAIDYAAWLTR